MTKIRRGALALTFLCLAAAMFAEPSVAAVASLARFPAAALFVLASLSSAHGKRPLKQVPSPARLVLRGSWMLVGLAILSAFWSVSPTATLEQATGYALLVLAMHVNVTRGWAFDYESTLQDVAVVGWVLTALCLASLLERSATEGRLRGLFANPNSLAMMAAVSLALMLVLQVHRRGPSVMIALAGLAIALLLTGSRTAAVAAAIVVLWTVRPRRQVPPAAAAAAAVTGATGMGWYIVGAPLPRTVQAVVDRFVNAQPGDLFNGRGEGWELVLRLWERQPWTGYGFRTGELVMDSRGGSSNLYDVAHNSYLQMLLELGYLAVLPCFVILVGVVKTLRGGRLQGSLSAQLGGVVLVGLAVAFTESALWGVGQAFSWAVWLMLAAAAATSSKPVDQVEPASVRQRRPAVH